MTIDDVMSGLIERMPGNVARSVQETVWCYGHESCPNEVERIFQISIFSESGNGPQPIEQFRGKELAQVAEQAFLYAESKFKQQKKEEVTHG